NTLRGINSASASEASRWTRKDGRYCESVTGISLRHRRNRSAACPVVVKIGLQSLLCIRGHRLQFSAHLKVVLEPIWSCENSRAAGYGSGTHFRDGVQGRFIGLVHQEHFLKCACFL